MDDGRPQTDVVTDAKPGADSEFLIPGFGLWSHGRPYRVPPKPYCLLAALWSAPDRSLDVADAIAKVCGVRPAAARPEHVDRLRVYATRIGSALEGTNIVVRVRRDRTSGRLRVSLVVLPGEQLS